MKNISITLDRKDMDHALTAIEFFLETLDTEVESEGKSHPQFKSFQHLQNLHERIASKFKPQK